MKTLTTFQQGQQLFLKGDLPASIKAFTRAIDQGLEPFKSHLSRGVAHLKLGEIDQALTDFEHSVALEQSSDRALFYRGIARLNQGKFSEAIDDLTTSIRLDPGRGAAFLARGLAHSELNHDKEAETDIRTAYAKNNTEIGTFLEEYAVSRSMFDRSIALFDGDRGPWKIVLTEDELCRMEQWQ